MHWAYDGLLGMPSLSPSGISHRSGRSFFVLTWAILVALAGGLAAIRLLDSRPGAGCALAQGGSTMAEAMGINTFRYKVTIFSAPRCWPPAGCSRTSSAPSTPRRSA
jgi:branched-chain amino acid transport system permease protein